MALDLQIVGKLFALLYLCKLISRMEIWAAIPLKACIARVSPWSQTQGRGRDCMQQLLGVVAVKQAADNVQALPQCRCSQFSFSLGV